MRRRPEEAVTSTASSTRIRSACSASSSASRAATAWVMRPRVWPSSFPISFFCPGSSERICRLTRSVPEPSPV
ncbi:Uncharacterised protein [Mycobacteroides abscessus subsp. abscessus]|nr:Uncharacterised protein [Mycobacteroides abscessus subsp. abscessus]